MKKTRSNFCHISPYLKTFFTAEEVWFWCCRCRSGDEDKYLKTNNQEERVCETNDIYIILKRLALKKLIGNNHIKILVRFGLEQNPPSHQGKNGAWCRKLWEEAMDCLGKELKNKGIIQ